MNWLLDRVKGAFNSWVQGAIVAGGVGLALLIWRFLRPHVSGEVAVPSWVVAVAVGVVAAVLIILGLRLRERGGRVEGIASVAWEIEQMLAMTTAYAEHLIEILYAFQRVLNADIPGVTIKEWIEDGILEPARDLIKTRQSEDVRLSILMPEDDDFVMAFAAGHTLESKTKFRLPIELSFSRWAYQTNTIYWSGSLANDDRFTRHPKATRERDYDSIISVPIRYRDAVVAVFNVIFTPSDAFDEADLLYIRLVGAVIELVWEITDGPGG